MIIRFCAAFALAALCFVSTAVFAADTPQYDENAQNPPPAAALDTFQHFTIDPVAMGAPFAGQKGNEVARERLQANLDERVKPLLAEWNAKGGEGGRTLKIQPEIRYIRFITGGKRFFGGGFAGASSILLKLKLTDAETGALVAEPDFYQHANALGAAWSFGATDKTMLIRIANMIQAYLQNNYDQTVGGSISQAPETED